LKEAKTGKVRYGQKLGKNQYRFKEYLPSSEELNKKLSHVNSSDQLVKDRFDSIFRRGILEPRVIKVHTNRSKNVKVLERFYE
jgi:hypothetical protein